MFTLWFRGWSSQYLNRWLILLNDLFFSVCASFIAIVLLEFLFGEMWGLSYVELCWIVLFSATCSFISFFLLKTYQGVIRYASYTETGRIVLAALLKVTLMLSVTSFCIQVAKPGGLFVAALLDFLVTFFVLITIRVVIMWIWHIA